MKTTHVISVKSNGRETGIFLVRQTAKRFEVDAIRTATDETKGDVRIANALAFALMQTLEKFDDTMNQPAQPVGPPSLTAAEVESAFKMADALANQPPPAPRGIDRDAMMERHGL